VKPASFEYLLAESVEDAVDALGRFDGNARCLAGGQSLVPLLNMRLMRPAAVVDLNRVARLDRIEVEDGVVRLGALVRYAALEHSRLVEERVPLLARAVPYVGDRQIRNRGTLGGALCHADPAGEMALAAVALGATLSVSGPDGRREIDVDEFFRGPYTTALGPADVLTGAVFPDGTGTVAVVVEHARRHGDFAVVSVAAVGRPGPGNEWEWVRIALGGVADRPRFAARASSLLAGNRLDAAAVRAAGEAALDVAEPVSDIRASADYRRHLVPVLVERALEALRTRALGEGPR
jgi:carbon-monoxide dehydrogenase medium subunit